jgi:hypothetical protein
MICTQFLISKFTYISRIVKKDASRPLMLCLLPTTQSYRVCSIITLPPTVFSIIATHISSHQTCYPFSKELQVHPTTTYTHTAVHNISLIVVMTIIPSRPGMEATLKRLNKGKIAGVSREYQYVRPLSWQIRPHSSFVVIKCGTEEELIVQLLVNEEHMMISADGTPSRRTDGKTNADYHLAAVVYINGVKQAQFRMKKHQMPTSVSSKVYTINVRNRGNGKGEPRSNSFTQHQTNY